MILSFLSWIVLAVGAQVFNPTVPVIVDRPYNVISEITVNGSYGDSLDSVEFEFEGIPASAVSSVTLMYSGSMSVIHSRSSSNGIKTAFGRWGGGQKVWCDPGYVIEKCRVKPAKGEDGRVKVTLSSKVPLIPGDNFFYVSMEVPSRAVSPVGGRKGFNLADTFNAGVTGVTVNGKRLSLDQEGSLKRRLGVAVRDAGDDGVDSYRIPGLVTSNKGTLVAVYDARKNNINDLNDDIDICVSRSFDGGLTWSRMETALDMGTEGGLPEAQNGVGDPAILLDQMTGSLFIMALWAHAQGNAASSFADGKQYPYSFSQPLIVRSDDDGATWSAPMNIFSGVTKDGWIRPFEGPGRGISMVDGTLVFPFQHLTHSFAESGTLSNAEIVYSKDHGRTWKVSGASIKDNTTEAQVAEIAPGVIMMNCRDHDGNGRAVYTTEDLGETWVEHPTSHTLTDPVCQAGLINVPSSGSVLVTGGSVKGNNLGRDILLFSNSDTPRWPRINITIKASTDKGITWKPSNSVLLDSEAGWGYSCMSMIDGDTVGILYESSTAQLVFQAVRLTDIVREF